MHSTCTHTPTHLMRRLSLSCFSSTNNEIIDCDYTTEGGGPNGDCSCYFLVVHLPIVHQQSDQNCLAIVLDVAAALWYKCMQEGYPKPTGTWEVMATPSDH